LQTGKTFLVSTNGTGAGSGNGASRTPTIGTDGRFVTFFSSATNIVPTPSFPNPSFFEWDRTLGKKYVVSSNITYATTVTPDGRYIAFAAVLQASGFLNIYVWDSLLGQRISTNSPLSATSFSAMAISTNGQWIASIGTAGTSGLSVIDRITRSNFVVSAGPFGARALPHFSDNGRYLVYATSAANSSTDLNGKQDIYLFDVQTRSNLLVSRSYLTGKSATGTSESPDISADGRYIIYQSDAADIVPSDNNHAKDIFLFDRLSGSTMLLSAGIYGAGTGNFASQVPRFTGDGQTVAFQSWASDLAPNDFNQGSDLFLLKILNPSDSTNPPPVLTGQIIYAPDSGSGSSQSAPQLTWAAVPGTGYQVQYKTNLTDDTWLPINGSVVIEGAQGYVKDLAPDPDHRFYRIVAQ
jgi:Tol biopolymer transport system component